MQSNVLIQRLAVCSWSLQPASPGDLLTQLRATGLRRVELDLDPLRQAPEVWSETAAFLRQEGVALVSGMFRAAGEDYSTLETIRATGGLTPDTTWEENWRTIQTTVAQAGRLGLKQATFHAGFLPHDVSDPAFAKMQQRLRQVADLFAERDIALGLETGQETARTLRIVLEQLDRPNVGVNFDPANMILYGKGDPIEAIETLGPWIRQTHIKDARRAKVPGTWGEEVPVGTGEVNWPAFFAALDKIGFTGNFCIEREAGDQRVADIRAAREHIDKGSVNSNKVLNGGFELR